MNHDEMSCQELVELVTQYLEGALSAREQALFEDHLRDCPGCRAYVQQMRQTIQTLGRLTEEHIAPAARQELLRVFRQWKASGE